MKKISILILVFLGLANFSYSESRYKDPFESLLPQEMKEEEKKQEEIIRGIEEDFPDMNVQGILWNGNFPQAIIDGEVYKVGDKLKNLSAQVFRIEKGAVFISYGEKIYKIKIGKEY